MGLGTRELLQAEMTGTSSLSPLVAAAHPQDEPAARGPPQPPRTATAGAERAEGSRGRPSASARPSRAERLLGDAEGARTDVRQDRPRPSFSAPGSPAPPFPRFRTPGPRHPDEPSMRTVASASIGSQRAGGHPQLFRQSATKAAEPVEGGALDGALQSARRTQSTDDAGEGLKRIRGRNALSAGHRPEPRGRGPHRSRLSAARILGGVRRRDSRRSALKRPLISRAFPVVEAREAGCRRNRWPPRASGGSPPPSRRTHSQARPRAVASPGHGPPQAPP